MSDEQKIKRGFWAGIVVLSLGAFLGGISLARGEWWQVAVNILVTVPTSIVGLWCNRKTSVLRGRIEEINAQIARLP